MGPGVRRDDVGRDLRFTSPPRAVCCRASAGPDACGCGRLPLTCWRARWRGRTRRGLRHCGQAASGTRPSPRRNENNFAGARSSGSIISSAAAGPRTFDTATARLSVTTGDGCMISSAPYKQIDLHPVGLVGRGGAGMQRRDRRLDLIRPAGAMPHRLVDQRQPLGDQLLIPQTDGPDRPAAPAMPSASKRAALRACCSSSSAVSPMISASLWNSRSSSRARRIASSHRVLRISAVSPLAE